jgi:hypothetical protein
MRAPRPVAPSTGRSPQVGKPAVCPARPAGMHGGMKEFAPDDPRRTPILLRKELLAQGLNDRAIRRLVLDHELVKVRRGAYAARAAWKELDDVGRHGLVVRAVVKQANTDVVASHSSALAEWNAPTWRIDLSHAHVTRIDGRSGRKEAGVTQHSGRLLDEDVVERNGVPLTSATRTALDITTIARTEPALAVVCHFLHTELTTRERLVERYRADSDGKNGMENWPNSLSTDIVLRLADPRIESVLEARGIYFCYQQSLPVPELQHEIRDDHGDVLWRLDFAWPEYGVWAELDGKVKYTELRRPGESVTDVVLREKRRQELISEATGWRCIRITWEDLARPERLALRIRAAMTTTRRAS